MQEAADEATAQLRRNELLILSASTGFAKDVEDLIADGADVNCKDKENTPLLHFPAAKGKIDILRFLISRGADVNSEDQLGQTALHYAAEENEHEAVKLLIKSKAWIDAYDANEDTPLHLAARKGRLQAVKQLLLGGAKIEIANTRNLTSLGEAIMAGHVEIIEMLMDKGADVRRVSKGYSLLHLAAGSGNEAVLATLLGSLSPDAVLHPNGVTPLHCAARKSVPAAVIRLLIKHGCDPCTADCNGRVALDWARDEGIDDPEVIKLLTIRSRRKQSSPRRPSSVTEIEPAAGPEDEWQAFQTMTHEEKLKQVEVWARSKEDYLNELAFLDKDSRRAVALVGRFMRMAQCRAAIERLKNDKSFQRDALEPDIQEVLAECTEQPQNIRKYGSNEKVMGVVNKLKRLQEVLRRNGRTKIVYEELLASSESTESSETEKDMTPVDLDKALQSAKEAVLKAVLGGSSSAKKQEEGLNWWNPDQKLNGDSGPDSAGVNSGVFVKSMLYQFVRQLLFALVIFALMVAGMYLTDSLPTPSHPRPRTGAPSAAIVTTNRLDHERLLQDGRQEL